MSDVPAEGERERLSEGATVQPALPTAQSNRPAGADEAAPQSDSFVNTTPIGECAEPAKWTPDHQGVIPRPFVRVVDWSMDSCAATNKSQFVMAGIGLIAACGLLDAIKVLFMVPGHTKFAPDLLARSFAGKFGASDVFNQRMLLQCMLDYSAAQVYDEHRLFHWKSATSGMFQPVDCITQYRYFLIVGDDGLFSPGPVVTLPQGYEAFPGRSAPLYSDVNVQEGLKNLARRSLGTIVRASLRGEKLFSSVGSGALPDAPDNFMPTSVQTSRRARLFMKRRPHESVWREQPQWMIMTSINSVNQALANLKPYSTTPDEGKEFYGQKLKSVRTQFGRFVPPKDVPDEFELLSGGQAQGLRSSRNGSNLDFFGGDTESPSDANGVMEGHAVTRSLPTPNIASTSGNESHRWKATRDASVLLAILENEFGGNVPSSAADIRKLVDMMPVTETGRVWDGGKLRKKAKELKKA